MGKTPESIMALRSAIVLLSAVGLHALSTPIPFLPRPYYLTDELAADAGFDPAGLVLSPLLGNAAALGDPVKVRRSLIWMREAEVKHARLAMLAAAGWPLAEMWHPALSSMLSLPYLLDATEGRVPSILNGGLSSSAGFLVLAFLVAAAFELKTLDQVHGLTATGKTMARDGSSIVIKSYVPGDCNFDPLGLHDFYGWQIPPLVEMRAKVDESYRLEWVRFNQKQMQAAELRNGRLAMLAITGFAAQEFIYKVPVVGQTPLFFTPITTLIFGQANLLGP